jgi:hypothetical protein
MCKWKREEEGRKKGQECQLGQHHMAGMCSQLYSQRERHQGAGLGIVFTESGRAKRNFGASTRISFLVTSSLTVENFVSGISTFTIMSRQLIDELSWTLQGAPSASSLEIFWRYRMSYFGLGLLSFSSTLFRSRPSPTSSSSQIWFGSDFFSALGLHRMMRTRRTYLAPGRLFICKDAHTEIGRCCGHSRHAPTNRQQRFLDTEGTAKVRIVDSIPPAELVKVRWIADVSFSR